MAVVEGAGIEVLSTSDGSHIKKFDDALLSPASSLFGEWLRQQPGNKRYVLFVIRPSGAARWKELLKVADSSCSGYGVDLVGEEIKIVLQEKGG